MFNPTTLAALATTAGARWLTPTGSSLQLIISTPATYSVTPAARPLWRPADTRAAREAGVRLRALLTPADAIVVALRAGGWAIPRPVPCAIFIGSNAPQDAVRLAPAGSAGFDDLIAILLDTPAPAQPESAEWGAGGEASYHALSADAQANTLKVATVLAVAQNRLAPAVSGDDIALAGTICRPSS